ncbi:MAG TPA: serpin family protein [Bacteroidales bacterium]|nr:serpin family protein [Bacteroidales bacterium]
MKHIALFILTAAISCFASAQPDSRFTEANNRFAFELFSNVVSGYQGNNVFVSPYSISSALAMTYAGARNETEKQMSAAMHFDLGKIKTQQGFSDLTNAITKASDSLTISIANAVWSRITLNPDFINVTRKYYGSCLFRYINADSINGWTKTHTMGKIDRIVTPDDVMDASVVLTNAIYFKGDWMKSFDVSKTFKSDFCIEDKKNVQADFMHRKSEYNYYEDSLCKMIELPYKGNDVSMIILLPEASTTASQLAVNLTADKFGSCRSQMKKKSVDLKLPKFSFTFFTPLNDVLIKMGMPLAFSSEADFSGMAPDLHIDKVLHKAFIQVDEKGSTAAAVTAVVMTKSIQLSYEFNANHPFIFIICDNRTSCILFMGYVNDPTKS